MLTDRASSERTSPYPSNDSSLQLPSGRMVRFYDLILVTGLDEPSFSVHYRSELERNDGARQAEAEEVIRYFADNSRSCKNIKRANASICSTAEQAASKELPEEIFQFERSETGPWRFVEKADLPPRTA